MSLGDLSPEEWSVRRDLAAAYRLIALFGWDDHVATHLSARLPDGSFLLNPFGLLFEEVTASGLIRVDMQGKVISPPDASLNIAGFTVHSGVLHARADINCAIHLHTHDGVAVSALEEGFMPLSQTALLIYSDIAYHDFDGVVAQKQEQKSLGCDLGKKNLMILRNHGTLTVGETVADAFYRMYTLEWCCTAQMRALASGRDLRIPNGKTIQQVGSAIDWSSPSRFSLNTFWPAMLRKAKRHCSSFDN